MPSFAEIQDAEHLLWTSKIGKANNTILISTPHNLANGTECKGELLTVIIIREKDTITNTGSFCEGCKTRPYVPFEAIPLARIEQILDQRAFEEGFEERLKKAIAAITAQTSPTDNTP